MIRSPNKLISRLAGVALLLALASTAAHAQGLATGNISGRVTDEATGKSLPGVTVTVSGPALQGEQTEFTDSNGHYIITELPPGEYIVRFYYSNVKVERPGVNVGADRTLSVNSVMPTAKAQTQTFRITERAPTVDVATTQVQTQVTDDLVRNTPVGRTYNSVLTLAPGAAVDPVGFSFNGATGPENSYLVDGMNTTNPAFGLLGTPLTLEFIKETEIITGGYNAEYGRATGGVVNVITKSGSNEFHGDVWFFYTPFMLEPLRIARPGEAVASIRKSGGWDGRGTDHAFDFGFDLGGPIVKDRIWFYAGFAPNFTTDSYERVLRTRTSDKLDPAMSMGTYAGDPDTSISCPSWLASQDPALCSPSKGGSVITKDLDKKYWQQFTSNSRLYNLIGKLTFRLNDNNNLTLTYLGSPSTFDGVFANPRNPNSPGLGFNGNPTALQFTNTAQVHDIIVHYTSKLLDRRLQLDVIGGWHYENYETNPGAAGNLAGSNRDTRTQPLSTFEPNVSPCQPQMVHGVKFNPCPVSNYLDGGFGFYDALVNQRIALSVGATYFARLFGTHAIKLGGDFEDVTYKDHRQYSGANASDPACSAMAQKVGACGGGRFTTLSDGTAERTQFGTVDPTDPTQMKVNVLPGGFTAETSTLNYSLYLRDSYNLSFLPGLTLNVGVRWEAQQVKGTPRTDPQNNPNPAAPKDTHTEIGIYDNIAPRIGFAYDFTGKGRSKLYASYGRFYESVPLDINDRQFSGEGLLIQDTMNCAKDANGRVNTNSCMYPTPGRTDLNGGTFGLVSPKLQGMYSNEVVAGLQYDVGLDLVLGAAYIHRDLGRIIEDMSPDGGVNYIVANPGEPTDQGTVSNLQNQINDLANQLKNTSDPVKMADLTTRRNNAVQSLTLYQSVETFDKPKRDYNALILTASKRLSHNFVVLASYTYSRTVGNYPGLFQASNGQLDPNISTQYDLKELLINRNGPLPNDHPHNLKLTGAYYIPLGNAGGITIGANFLALSGVPIEVLGRHPTYGPNETFILPRGSGGRTPTVTQLDLRLAYSKQFGKNLRAELSADVFNVLDQQQVTAVDPSYSLDRVLPIPNGTYADLAHLKNTNGTQPRLNPNYGQPTQYQNPLSMRFGARISF